MKLWASYRWLLLLLAVRDSVQWVCSSQCAMIYDGYAYSDSMGCNSGSANDCTVCDQTYYNPSPSSGGACVQGVSSIYNTTIQMSMSTFGPGVGTTNTNTRNGHTCKDMSSSASVFAGVVYPGGNTGIYALRFRLLVRSTSTAYPTYTFVAQNYREVLQIKHLVSSAYGEYWIHTTGQIAEYDKSTNVILYLSNAPATTDVGICDIWVMIAYCVPNCIACRSLTSCTACESTYLLVPSTNLCVQTCPTATYNETISAGEFQCLDCDPKCLQCSTDPTTCTKCTDSGEYEAFLDGTTCYLLGNCPNGLLENFQDHTCYCPPNSEGYVLQLGVCIACPDRCINCAADSTQCTKCIDSGFNEGFLDGTTCYALGDCPNDFIENFDDHTCHCPTPEGYVLQMGVCIPCPTGCINCDADSTQCTKCIDSGYYEAFLLVDTCYLGSCPSGYVENYDLHTCQCPKGYFETVNICTACDPACLACNDATLTDCQECAIGYFHYNTTDTCAPSCPAGQYAVLIYDLAVCYLCDTTACVQCVNSSTACTNCNFGTNDRWLFDYQCLYICPDGYEGNNATFVCDQCVLGMYSYKNRCYSYCPLYYEQNDNIRACVLPGGYPLNLTVSVLTKDTLQMSMDFKILLDSAWVTYLTSRANWQQFVKLYFRTQTDHTLVFGPRLLMTSTSAAIDTLQVTDQQLVLTTTAISPYDFVSTHSFYIRFSDNLVNSEDVFYKIEVQNNTDTIPWVVREYYDLNVIPLYFIGIILGLSAVIILLMRVKYVYRVTVEYLHCLQLLGLTLWVTYPHSITLRLYSFLLGIDFTNFSFMYNIPRNLIDPCTDCQSLVSYAFMQGDMNWLRLVGSMLLCLLILLMVASILACFKCARSYSIFFIALVCDMFLIKAIHSWFASLVYAGLNFSWQDFNSDFFIFGMHLFSYVVMLPLLVPRILAMISNWYINISLIGTYIFVILLSILSLAPELICSLLVLVVLCELFLIVYLNIVDEEVPLDRKNNEIQIIDRNMRVKRTPHEVLSSEGDTKEIKDSAGDKFQQSIQFAFHFFLLRSMKPITAFFIALLVLVNKDVIVIAVIATLELVLFVLILLDAYLCYTYFEGKKKKKTEQKKVAPTPDPINQTKQNLKDFVRPNHMIIYDEDDIDNDDIVSNKFRATAAHGKPSKDSQIHYIKNMDS